MSLQDEGAGTSVIEIFWQNYCARILTVQLSTSYVRRVCTLIASLLLKIVILGARNHKRK